MFLLKKGFKMLAAHATAVILTLVVISILEVVLSTRGGASVIWGGVLIIYAALIYSEGWNMAAYDRKPFYKIKPSILRPVKASLVTLIVPAVLLIISFIPMNAWRPFAIQCELSENEEYTILLTGGEGAYVDDIGALKIPDNAYAVTPENLVASSDFEVEGGWELLNAATTTDEARSGETSVVFSENGELKQSFTAKESGIHHISGYYKGDGNLAISVKSADKEIGQLNVSETVVPLNKQIFKVGSNLWFLPLSSLYNNGKGDVTPFHVLYLSLILPLLAVIGYYVGKTGFSFSEKYMAFKAKQLEKKRIAAEAEEKAIKEERKRFKK